MPRKVPNKGWSGPSSSLTQVWSVLPSRTPGLLPRAWNAAIAGLPIVCRSAVARYRYGAWAAWSNPPRDAAASPFLLGFGTAQPAIVDARSNAHRG
ncbi:hypothetical protein CN155_21235 [Sinorhizobium meliloti]|uniref:hypothetical protein n=1 Tax=Rhizobium meliloti TaxID=382 RepID=UPI000FD80BB3|nr:hypothetical protein [Sinorhizobium meliloti]MDE3795748.1 hypothetical protein [Sinorhizobium meliloti]RVK52841.1 hypothetical protein CN155_21235 [Sinorhizobium meliloti]